MKIKTILISAICMIAASCVKDKLETTYSKQETQIDAYITKNMVVKRDSTRMEVKPNADDPTINDTTYVKVQWEDTLRVEYNNGAARLIKKEGSGEELTGKGAISFRYAGYVFTTQPSTLFATNDEQTAKGAGFALTDADYGLFEADMTDAYLVEGLRNGLMGTRTGEECEIIFSGKYGFGNEVFGTIPVNSALLYKIWDITVSNE
jgi:FKBP-type peptidyl-prolyl cis-trans isomerase